MPGVKAGITGGGSDQDDSMDVQGANGSGMIVSADSHLFPPCPPAVYNVPDALERPARVWISWGNGNQLHISYMQQSLDGDAAMGEGGARVVGVQPGGDLDAERRRIAYGSLPAFALLQNQRQMLLNSAGQKGSLLGDWWEHVLEYSRSIGNVLSPEETPPSLAPERTTKDKTPTVLKAVWELIEVFYVDKTATSWIPERLVDWLASYDKVFSTEESTVHSKLVSLQRKIPDIQFPEDDPDYWDGMVSALAVGWLDIVTSILRMHGSYRLDQLDDRQTENGLVEAVTLLIAKMPRLRPSLPDGSPGIAFGFKPDFAKAWEKWRGQVAKLENSTFWAECNHRGTLIGLKKMLQVLLGNVDILVASTFQWMELLVAHLLYVIPFSLVSEGMLSVATKCKQLKDSGNEDLRELMTAIMGNDTEVLLAESSRLFDSWMMAHLGDLLTAKSSLAQSLLQEERQNLGGLSLQELHRLVYAQVLSSHSLTWQLAPVYLASCPKQGLGMLENLLLKQQVSGNNKLALKALEICRLYELGPVETAISRAVGLHSLKHGKKGAGILWLQRARDEHRLSAIADQLLKSVTSGGVDHLDNLQHLEGLLDLLGSGTSSIEGLSFLNRYKDFKTALQSIHEIRRKESYSDNLLVIGRAAVDSLLQLLKSGTLPRRFWLSLLQDSVELLEWPERALISESETCTLLCCLQELFLAKDRGHVDVLASLESAEATVPLERVRLALASNLGRAMLQS